MTSLYLATAPRFYSRWWTIHTQELLDPHENRVRKVGVTLMDLADGLHNLGDGERDQSQLAKSTLGMTSDATTPTATATASF